MADLPVDNEDLSLKIIKVVHSEHFRHCNQGFFVKFTRTSPPHLTSRTNLVVHNAAKIR
jgi:hypothetical protein